MYQDGREFRKLKDADGGLEAGEGILPKAIFQVYFSRIKRRCWACHSWFGYLPAEAVRKRW
jgi:hypothetical protein